MDNEDEEFCEDCGNKLYGQPKYRDGATLCESCYTDYEDTQAEKCAECEVELDGQGEWYKGQMLCRDCYKELEDEDEYWEKRKNIPDYDENDPDATPGLSWMTTNLISPAIFPNLPSSNPGYTPIQNIFSITKSVHLRLPATRYPSPLARITYLLSLHQYGQYHLTGIYLIDIYIVQNT
jgi:hypothetical protein